MRFISLYKIEKLYANHIPLFIKIENRKSKESKEYGMINHAELLEYNYKNKKLEFLINKSDSKPWDIILPGHENKLPYNNIYKLDQILGIIHLCNNNHKLICSINHKNELINIRDDINKYYVNYSIEYFRNKDAKYSWLYMF